MALTSRLRDWLFPTEQRAISGIPDWYANLAQGYMYPLSGLNQTMPGTKEEIEGTFAGLATGAFQRNGVIFACMLARLMLFTEARFQYRQLESGRPGKLFGNASLAILEHPEPGKTTGDMLGRAIQDADLAGNWFGLRRGGTIKRLRPDWMTIVMGSDTYDIDAQLIGYIYHPGGRNSGEEPVSLLREEVAHFAPIPDPQASYRGMSWLTPIIRETQSDNAATAHKLAFFENGATPNMVVKLDPAIPKDKFQEWVDLFEKNHTGVSNAYKTLYMGAGADATVVGTNFQQMDFKQVQGAGETRIAAAANVPPIIVGLSEGLQAATYSNYGQARRRFADLFARPAWRNFAGSLETIVPPPGGSQLWYDDRDIPFLTEDMKDRAEIQASQSSSIRQLVDAGFDPETAIAAIIAGDFSKLTHTGLYSVQLQPPMPDGQPATPVAAGRALADLIAPFLNGRSHDDA